MAWSKAAASLIFLWVLMKTDALPESANIDDRRADGPKLTGPMTLAEMAALAKKRGVVAPLEEKPESGLAKAAGIEDIK